MSTSIVMPQLGESVAEGVIGKWLKQEGDTIEKDEPIVEVITDKVNAEIPAPLAGVLERIVQPEGATVAVGEEIAVIGDGGARVQTEPEEQASTGVEVGAPAAYGSSLPAGAVSAPDAASRINAPASDTAQTPPAAAAVLDAADTDGTNGRDRVRSSPLVRRLAAEHGIDLGQVSGTGIGGRVSKQDILSFVEQIDRRGEFASTPPQLEPVAVPDASASQTPAFTPVSMPTPTVAQPEEQPPRPQVAAAAQPAAQARALGPNEELVPVSPLRKMIAARMVQSKSTIPHATTMMEVDMTGVARYRDAHKGAFQEREGIGLSYVAFVIKATVEALKQFPIINSEWTDDGIVMKRDININVAVDAPDGLTTPVVHHADERNLAGLAKGIADVAVRARNKKLTVNDMQGGTFTVNNTGSLGSMASVSIINYPQAGILTANAIVKRPVVIEQDGAELVAVRSMMNLSFSFDHRLIDGGTATAFLSTVKRQLESWSMDYPVY